MCVDTSPMCVCGHLSDVCVCVCILLVTLSSLIGHLSDVCVCVCIAFGVVSDDGMPYYISIFMYLHTHT